MLSDGRHALPESNITHQTSGFPKDEGMQLAWWIRLGRSMLWPLTGDLLGQLGEDVH